MPHASASLLLAAYKALRTCAPPLQLRPRDFLNGLAFRTFHSTQASGLSGLVDLHSRLGGSSSALYVLQPTRAYCVHTQLFEPLDWSSCSLSAVYAPPQQPTLHARA